MSQVITNAFEQYWQSSLAAEQPVVLDEFILADIPNLDITAPIDPDTVLPPESQIVHRQNVDQRGRVNNNAVAYTIVMDTTVGDFSFNAMYLRNKQNGVIGMIVYKGRETKLKTVQTTGQTGNSLVKSMLMGYDQAAEATLTHVDAGTWQIDYAARLSGMDEDIRQLQADLYGHHTFVGDGFKVVEKDGAYQVTQGVAIIGGLRVELKAPEVIHPGTKPIGVWVDVHRAGSLLSEHQNHFTIITSVAELTDHVDGSGYQHYVAKLGIVQPDNTVLDGRGITRGGETSLPESFSLLEQADATLAITSWEALRRSYAEAGYNLRPESESFGAGGILTSAIDVLLDKVTGKAYSWAGTFPKTVEKGTNPLVGGFTVKSNVLLSQNINIGFAGIYRRQTTVAEIATGLFPAGTRLTLTDRGGADFDVVAGGAVNGFNILNAGNGNTAQLVVRSGVINTQHWGMIADYVDEANPGTDNKAAFAALMNHINVLNPLVNFTVYLHGTMGTSDTVTLCGGGTYGGRALRFEAMGSKVTLAKIGTTTSAPLHSVVYLKKSATSGAFACANVTITNLNLGSATADYGVASNDDITMFSDDDDLDISLTKAGSIGYYFTSNIYINHFGGGMLWCAGKAFKNTNSGTTNFITNLYANGCQNGAFELRMVYSKIGCLAADDCVGTIYDLGWSQLSIGSLGCESAGATQVVYAHHGASISIDNIWLQKLSASASFTVVAAEQGSSVIVGSVNSYASNETPTIMTGGRLMAIWSSNTKIEIHNITGHYIYGVEDSLAAGSSALIGEKSGELVQRRDVGIATMGGARNSNPQWYNNGISRPAKTFFLNHGSSHLTLVDGTDVQWNGSGMKAGDIIWLNNAGTSGMTAMVVVTPGADFRSSTYKNLPVEEYVADVASLPTGSLRTGRRVSVIAIHKTLTYYASGTVGWYDETGAKIA